MNARPMRLIAACSLLCVLALGACEPPPVVPSADERQQSETSRIEGDVVITGGARGNVVLSLFAAERPPPPEGTGRPISFAFIPGEKVFGSAYGDPSNHGPFTAPYAFSLVPEGKYLVKGFVDRDGCVPNLGCRSPDFVPWYGVTGEPSAGDVGGAAVDPTTRAVRVISVHRDDLGALIPATGVSVSFAESATVPADRPAFRVNSASRTLDLTKPASVVELEAEKIVTDQYSLTAPTFFARWIDDDADGVPDDKNKDGIPEFWPKVIVRKLADRDPPLLDENDLDRNGLLDEQGADYAHADGPEDGLTDAVVLAAGFRPDSVAAALTHMDGSPRMTPVPLSKLQLVIRPMALDARDPAKPVPLAQVPSGRYAIIVIQFTGQTWRVPNELQPSYAEAVGLPAVDTQGFFLEVP